MFGSNPKANPAAPQAASNPPSNGVHQSSAGSARTGAVLSSGVSIIGDVTFRNELVIDGEVEGNITSTGKLTVGTHAAVRGEIRAGLVTILGSVEGNVFASERCALEAGASLQGDIESPRLAVDENASFFGAAKISSKAATNKQ
jgi:cytoskeletal protein CcmA (bactofilin family)